MKGENAMWFIYTTDQFGTIQNSYRTDMFPPAFINNLRAVFPEFTHQVFIYDRFCGQQLTTYGVSHEY